jgi:hypothetical protein
LQTINRAMQFDKLTKKSVKQQEEEEVSVQIIGFEEEKRELAGVG